MLMYLLGTDPPIMNSLVRIENFPNEDQTLVQEVRRAEIVLVLHSI